MYGDHRDCPNCNVRHKSKAALKHRARSLSGDGTGRACPSATSARAASFRSLFNGLCRALLLWPQRGYRASPRRTVGIYKQKGLIASVLPDAS